MGNNNELPPCFWFQQNCKSFTATLQNVQTWAKFTDQSTDIAVTWHTTKNLAPHRPEVCERRRRVTSSWRPPTAGEVAVERRHHGATGTPDAEPTGSSPTWICRRRSKTGRRSASTRTRRTCLRFHETRTPFLTSAQATTSISPVLSWLSIF